MCETSDTASVANYLFHGIAKHNADVFKGMVAVHPEISFCSADDIEPAMLCHRGKHMIKKRDSAVHGCLPVTVRIQGYRYIRFFCFPVYRYIPH